MERPSIDEQEAFNMLRDQARRTNRRIVDLADAVVAGQLLLPAQPTPQSE
jgi:AmiR/NasT family two-component response regulator